MTEDDKLIIRGIITVFVCLTAVILATMHIEKRIALKKSRWFSYLGLFSSVGLLLILRWSFPSADKDQFIIQTPTLIGMAVAVLTRLAFLTVFIIKIDRNVVKELTEKAIIVGKELNLTVHGIPVDPKASLNSVYFY